MAKKIEIDPKLIDYCVSTEVERFQAIIDAGGILAASKATGVNRGTLSKLHARVKRRAASRGYSPEHDYAHAVPETHYAKGVSTLYDADGKVRLQWVKSHAQADKLAEVAEQMVEAFRELSLEPPRTIPAPTEAVSELLTVYPIADQHLGMLAWADESGESYDTRIGCQLLGDAMANLVSRSPPSEVAVVASLGDYFHTDNMRNQTPRSGNNLDVDGRLERTIRLGTELFARTIELALQRHKRVRVIAEAGNHDEAYSYLLAGYVAAWFRNEPRVEVDMSPGEFHYYRHGRNLIGTHHGHDTKIEHLPAVMAVDRREDWGEIDHGYWLTGHIHHLTRKEFPGCIVESFRTLAGKDAYHTARGYRSGRDMVSIVYDLTYGELERHTCSVKMVQGGLVHETQAR